MTKPLRFILAALICVSLLACATPRVSLPVSSHAGNAVASVPPSQMVPDTQPAGPMPMVLGLPPAPGTNTTYRIGPQDLLKVEVFRVDELSSKERVSQDGTIVMPLIGPVMVAGLTPQEAEDRLTDILGKDYLQDPQVNIFVEEYASQKVTVTGSVKSPGVFPLTGYTTLLQAVALAGGVDELANTKEVVLFRGQGGPAQAYVVNLKMIQEGDLQDPVVIGDDRIVIPQSGSAALIKNVTGTIRGFVRPI